MYSLPKYRGQVMQWPLCAILVKMFEGYSNGSCQLTPLVDYPVSSQRVSVNIQIVGLYVRLRC